MADTKKNRTDVKKLKAPNYLQPTLNFLRERYGVKFKMTGDESGECCCPIHDEKTPSFKLYVHNDLIGFHCFGGCNRDYDVFNIIMERDGVRLPEAISTFKDYLKQNHISAPKDDIPFKGAKPSDQSPAPTDSDFEEELEFAANVYHEILLNDDPELKEYLRYLTKRGVDNKLIRDFSIGVSPSYKSSYNGRALCDAKGNRWHLRDQDRLMKSIHGKILYCLKNKGVPYEIADHFACKLVFPVRGLDGKVKALMGRNTKEGGEWRTHKGAKKGNLLYGLDRNARNIIQNKTAIIVEGIYDFMALHKLFKDPDLHSVVVATMGPITKTQVGMLEGLPSLLGARLTRKDATEEEQAELLKSLEVDNYIAAFDNDEAGGEFLNRLTELVGPDKNVFRMDMLGFKDANEVYAQVPRFLDINQLKYHMEIARNSTSTKPQNIPLWTKGGLIGEGKALGLALRLKMHRRSNIPTNATFIKKPKKKAEPKIKYYDGNRLGSLLYYTNNRMPKSRIKDIEAVFEDYSAEPFEGSVKLHSAFVKWGYKKAGAALLLLLWLIIEQQRRNPHEVSENSTEIANELKTTSRTIKSHMATLRQKGFLVVDEDIKTRRQFRTVYLNPDSPKKQNKHLRKGRRRVFPPVIG